MNRRRELKLKENAVTNRTRYPEFLASLTGTSRTRETLLPVSPVARFDATLGLLSLREEPDRVPEE